MCGINGFNWGNEDLIQKMNAVITHRGPDGSSFYIDSNISLGHNRLSIIDLDKRSAQPMSSPDDRFVIVFNGEIYNYKQLKKTELKDYFYKTESDTEVILAAYEKWGKDCVLYLRGIFAFVIYDKRENSLFLARDIQGVKPLYYAHVDNRFIFSSEIKSIIEHDISRRLDRNAFNLYMHLLYVPEPLTLIDSVKKLPQASYAFFQDGKLSIHRYWTRGGSENGRVTKTGIQSVIDEAVVSQLVSDRPLGVYLSGGIDSTVILDSVCRHKSNVSTFSIGFDLSSAEESGKFNSDMRLARETSKKYKTDHHEYYVSSEDLVNNFERMVWNMDEPIANPTSLPLYLLSKFAKEEVSVVLGGDGGDELFGGYERYRLSYFYNILLSILRPFYSVISKIYKSKSLIIPSEAERIFRLMSVKPSTIERVVCSGYFDNERVVDFFESRLKGTSAKSFVKRFMDVDRATWLVDFDLMLADKMSMAHGLEVRVPLLDQCLIEYTSSIKPNQMFGFKQTKKILRSAFAGVLPNFIVNEPKRGFFSPGSKWLRHKNVSKMASMYLNADYNTETRALFNFQELKLVFYDHITSKKYNLSIIWAIMVFQSWAKQYRIEL